MGCRSVVQVTAANNIGSCARWRDSPIQDHKDFIWRSALAKGLEKLSSYDELLVERYINKGLLIDSNLLLLHLIGSYDIRLVRTGGVSKLSQYSEEDFGILQRLMKAFAKTVTTPHVLTEVTNLATDLPALTRESCLCEFIGVFGEFDELKLDSLEMAQRQEFRYLGLTDTALAKLSTEFLVLTSDARLVGRLNNMGLEALNFNHLRLHLLPT
jgi:hypothetical protein